MLTVVTQQTTVATVVGGEQFLTPRTTQQQQQTSSCAAVAVVGQKPVGRAAVFINQVPNNINTKVDNNINTNGGLSTVSCRPHHHVVPSSQPATSSGSSSDSSSDVVATGRSGRSLGPVKLVVASETVAVAAAVKPHQQLQQCHHAADAEATTTTSHRQHHRRHVTSLSSSSSSMSTSSASFSSSSESSSSSSSSSSSALDGYSRVKRCLPVDFSERDIERLMATCAQLVDCSFYLAELTSPDAKSWLRRAPTGTFLLRDSAHPSFLYSLTVKTSRGVTSIRISYSADGFRLDSAADQVRLMPAFSTVLALVSSYVAESRPSSSQRKRSSTSNGGTAASSARGNASSCILLDLSGSRSQVDVPVVLTAPCRGRVTSLAHLCRVSINGALDGRSADRLCISPSLKDFMKQYTYSIG